MHFQYFRKRPCLAPFRRLPGVSTLIDLSLIKKDENLFGAIYKGALRIANKDFMKKYDEESSAGKEPED